MKGLGLNRQKKKQRTEEEEEEEEKEEDTSPACPFLYQLILRFMHKK